MKVHVFSFALALGLVVVPPGTSFAHSKCTVSTAPTAAELYGGTEVIVPPELARQAEARVSEILKMSPADIHRERMNKYKDYAEGNGKKTNRLTPHLHLLKGESIGVLFNKPDALGGLKLEVAEGKDSPRQKALNILSEAEAAKSGIIDPKSLGFRVAKGVSQAGAAIESSKLLPVVGKHVGRYMKNRVGDPLQRQITALLEAAKLIDNMTQKLEEARDRLAETAIKTEEDVATILEYIQSLMQLRLESRAYIDALEKGIVELERSNEPSDQARAKVFRSQVLAPAQSTYSSINRQLASLGQTVINMVGGRAIDDTIVDTLDLLIEELPINVAQGIISMRQSREQQQAAEIANRWSEFGDFTLEVAGNAAIEAANSVVQLHKNLVAQSKPIENYLEKMSRARSIVEQSLETNAKAIAIESKALETSALLSQQMLEVYTRTGESTQAHAKEQLQKLDQEIPIEDIVVNKEVAN